MGSLFEKWKKGLKKKVHPFCTAIVPAAGKSSRMGGEDLLRHSHGTCHVELLIPSGARPDPSSMETASF